MEAKTHNKHEWTTSCSGYGQSVCISDGTKCFEKDIFPCVSRWNHSECFPLCVQPELSVCPGFVLPVSALLCFTTWQLSKHWMWLRHDPGSVSDSELDPKIVFFDLRARILLHFNAGARRRLEGDRWCLTRDMKQITVYKVSVKSGIALPLEFQISFVYSCQ